MVSFLLQNLDNTFVNHVEIPESHKTFKFGDERKVIAISKVEMPAQIGNKYFIKSKIVKENIPILLSKLL